MTTAVRTPRKTLPGVITKAKWLPPLMCIFGTPGIGKSTFAAGAPNPIFVTTENGVDNLDVARFPKAETLAEFLRNLRMVAEEDHEHGAVVIDTLTGLMDLYHQDKKDIPGDKGKPLYDFVGYGGSSGWSGVAKDFRAEVLPLFLKCKERGMYVILLAHTGEYTRKNPLGPDILVAAPSVSKAFWKDLLGYLDVIGRADFVYSGTAIDKAGTKVKASTDVEMVDGVKVKVRQLCFESGAEQDCKARVGYELPATMPLSWEAFASSLGNIKALAGEIRDLWKYLPADKAAGTLAWLGVNSLEQLAEANRAKLSQIRNRLLELKASMPPDEPEAPAVVDADGSGGNGTSMNEEKAMAETEEPAAAQA